MLTPTPSPLHAPLPTQDCKQLWVVYNPNTKGDQENVLISHWSEYLLLEIIQILLSESEIISLLQSTPYPLSSPSKPVAYAVPA